MQSLLIFSKLPLGSTKVKTRLFQSLSLSVDEQHRLALALLSDTLSTAAATQQLRLIAAFEPFISMQELSATFRRFKVPAPHADSLGQVTVIPQRGDDFASRLQNAFHDCVRAVPGDVLVIGSDAPTLPASYLIRACDALARGAICLGPTHGGGMYAIGLPSSVITESLNLQRIFCVSPESELVAMAAYAQELERSLHLLPFHFDIDLPSDLASLLALLPAIGEENRHQENELSVTVASARPDFSYPHATAHVLKQLGIAARQSDDNTREFSVVRACGPGSMTNT